SRCSSPLGVNDEQIFYKSNQGCRGGSEPFDRLEVLAAGVQHAVYAAEPFYHCFRDWLNVYARHGERKQQLKLLVVLQSAAPSFQKPLAQSLSMIEIIRHRDGEMGKSGFDIRRAVSRIVGQQLV